MRDQAIKEMVMYFHGDEGRVNHALKVLKHTEDILSGEFIQDSFTREAAVLAAVFHDIGIPEAERKFGSGAPVFQEQEGPPVARMLMEKIGVRADLLERVCFIVGNHHTKSQVDGLDFQILWEADLLVNLEEGWIPKPETSQTDGITRQFETNMGKKLIESILR